jgi:hypothetical protein
MALGIPRCHPEHNVSSRNFYFLLNVNVSFIADAKKVTIITWKA